VELTNDFSVPVPVDHAWLLLTDMAKIGPCMPGATITSVEGDQFGGSIKIKVGPIVMTFKGAGEFVEKDQAGKRAVLSAKGRDLKGNGTAQATITATLLEEDGGTKVLVATDLTITGKAAQFGGTVIKDISATLLGQFATNLEGLIGADGPLDEPPTSSIGPTSTPPAAEDRVQESTVEVDALKLLMQSHAARAQARSLVTALIGLCVALLGVRKILRSIR
jgi:carbon monoxide dehydrogenase subunit G